MAQGEQPDKNKPSEEQKVDKDELTPEDLDDITGGAKPAFTREAGPIFVK